jgi:signal transduction histidine kinase
MRQGLRSATQRVAHKIKNPVGFLLAAADNCLRELSGEGGEVEAALHRIQGYAQRIGKVADELAHFLMPPKVKLEPLDLPALAQEVVSRVCADTSYVASVPPPPASWPLLLLDRSLCLSILEEFLTNALNAMPGGGQISLEYTGPHDPDTGPVPTMTAPYVTLAVADDGPGVAPGMQKVLFEPYRTTRAQGTGLGLAIVKNYALAQGGEVREDGPGPSGRGARFRLAFPVHLHSGGGGFAAPPDGKAG